MEKIDREEHIKNLSYIMDSMPDDACGDWRDSLAYAIETIRKYQKIKEIYDNWNVDFGVETHRAMNKIGEVLKDGTGDN